MPYFESNFSGLWLGGKIVVKAANQDKAARLIADTIRERGGKVKPGEAIEIREIQGPVLYYDDGNY